MIPVGMSASTNILVGNNIGAMNLELSKFYARMCISAAFMWSTLSIAVMYLLQSTIISVFSTDPVVNGLIYDAYFMLAIFVFFDCMQGVGTGVIRGLGK